MSGIPCDLIIDAAWILPVAPVNSALRGASIAVTDGHIVRLGDREHVHAEFSAGEVLDISHPDFAHQGDELNGLSFNVRPLRVLVDDINHGDK